jgi:hypothetical protein
MTPGKSLEYRDTRETPAAWARELGIPREAVELYLSCEVVDLHAVSFVWSRVLAGYRLAKRHRPRLPKSAFINQADLPRVREAQIAAVCWDIPTNPFRRRDRRPWATHRDVERITQTLGRFPDEFVIPSAGWSTASSDSIRTGSTGSLPRQIFPTSCARYASILQLSVQRR